MPPTIVIGNDCMLAMRATTSARNSSDVLIAASPAASTAAEDLGVRNKVFVARGHEPSTPYYNYQEIKDIGGLPALVGL